MELVYKVIAAPGEHDKAIIDFFRDNDQDFYPPIAARKDLTLFVQNVYDENGRYIVVYESDRIVALTTLLANHPQFLYYYQYIAVDKDYRGKGIASVLYDKVTELCEQDDTTRAIVKTWSKNIRSQTMFRKHGFFHTETIEDDRSKGIHSLFFVKSFSKVRFNTPLTGLCIAGGGYGVINFVRTFFAITRDKGPLPFVMVNDPGYAARAEQIVAGCEQSHLLFTDLLLYPSFSKPATGNKPEIPDLLTITHDILRKNGKRWLLISTDADRLADAIDLDHVVVPDPHSNARVLEIVSNIQAGHTTPAYYKEELAAMAELNSCAGIVLGGVELHTAFGFDRSFKGVEIFDVFLEMAIILQNARMAQE